MGLGLIGIRRAVQAPRQITLDATAISAPKSLASRKIIHVPYDTIIGLEFQTVQKQHFLNIHHNAGKLSIAASGLADVATLENIAQELQARIA